MNLLGIGNLHADGSVRGSTTAELTARQVDVLAGDAVVSAKDTPSLHVLSQLPGVSVSVISVNVATAEGRIGEENSTQRNSVRAQVGDGTTLNVHDGDFSLLAANEPAKNEIVIDNGLNVGLVNVTVSCAGTETYLETAATVGKGASIKAVGAYTQLAQDKPNAATRASGSSIGIGISADNYFAENIAVSAVRATVGEGANIQALNGIRVEAVSDAVLSAITDADQGGVFTEGVLKSRNAVERELRTELGRDVTLYTLGGDIHVRVTSGQHDSITTRTLDSAAQLIGISDVRANTTITTKQYIDLYPGLHVENLTGDVYIVATAGADKIDNYSENRTSAAYASQTGKAETTLDLTTHIVFNDEGTEPEQFVFIGRDLWFFNWLNEIDVKNELYISNAGFSGSIYPTNTVLIDLDMLLDVWYGKTVANGGIRYLNMGYHEDYNAPGSMRFDNHARLDLPLLSLSALRAMIEGGNQNTVVSFEGSLHTYTHKTRNLFTVGDDCETLTGFLGEESSGMLRRSDIEYTLLGSDSFKYSVFNSFDDGVNNSLIHDYADFPWLGIPQMLEEEGPVIVDITDDGVTVTGDTDGIIRAAYDASAGAWVFEPIVKDIYEGMIIESFLPEDIIIVNRSRSDLILQGIAFAGDVMGSSSVKIVSGRDTDLYIWGDIAQRIDHPDAPDGHYSLYEQVTWWGPEGGRLYQGRKNDISITIDGDGRYTRTGEGSESIEISASPDAYTLKNILQNAANVVSIRGQMTLENCLEHVIYNGGHVTITNNTAKDLIFEGAGFGGGSFVQYIGKNHYQVITEPSDSSFRVINNAGGALHLRGDVTTKRFEAVWNGASGDFTQQAGTTIHADRIAIRNAANIGTEAERLNVSVLPDGVEALEASGNIWATLALRASGYAVAPMGVIETAGDVNIEFINASQNYAYSQDVTFERLAGRNITLWLDRYLSLTGAQDGAAVEIDAENDLSIFLSEISVLTTIGTREDPLAISVGGKFHAAAFDEDGNILDADFKIFLEVPEGDLDATPTSMKLWTLDMPLYINVQNGSLTIGDIAANGAILRASGDMTIGNVSLATQTESYDVRAGGDLRIASITLNSIVSGDLNFAADGDLTVENGLTTFTPVTLQAGGDVYLRGQTSVQPGGHLTVLAGGDVYLDDLVSKHQTTIDVSGDIIAGSVWVCGAAEMTAQGVFTAEKLHFRREYAQVDHDLRLTVAGDVSIGELIVDYGDFYLESTGGNIDVDAYSVHIFATGGQFALEAPQGSVTMRSGSALSVDGFTPGTLSGFEATARIHAGKDVDLSADGAIFLDGPFGFALDILSDAGAIRLGSIDNSSQVYDLRLSFTGDATIRALTYSGYLMGSEGTLRLTATGDLTIEETLRFRAPLAVDVAGTFAVAALEGDSAAMDVRAKNIRFGSANITLRGAGSIVADEEFSVNDFYYCGYSYDALDIRAARQAGTIISFGVYNGDLTFTIEEGDLRADYVNIESGNVTLEALTGSLRIDTVHAAYITGLYAIELRAGLDIGSSAAPLKYVVTSAWTPANCTENFVWTRDLYLDYDRTGSTPLTLNKQGAGNIYLTTHGRGVEITQSGALGGVIDASGQSVSITTTSGSIGTQEAPLVIEAAYSLTLASAQDIWARGTSGLRIGSVAAQGSVSLEAQGALTGVAGHSANITSDAGEIDLRASSISSATLHGAAGKALTARVAANLAQLYVDHDADVTLLLSGVGRLGGELRSAGTLTIENTAEAGALTLEGALEAESITVRVPGALTLGGTAQAGNIDAQADSIAIDSTARIAATENIRLHVSGDLGTDHYLGYSPDYDELPAISAGGLAEMHAGGSLALYADVEAGSLSLEAGADATLFGAFNATAGGLNIVAGGGLTLLMTEPGEYTGDTRDHMTLRANGDITIAAAGAFAALCYDRSWEKIMQDSGEMARKAVTIESVAGNISITAADISTGALLAPAGDVLASAEGALRLEYAKAQGRIDLRGLESIAVFANADENGAPAPGLEAASFAFTSHGDITDGDGGEVLLRFTGGLTPVTLREIGHGAQVLLADLNGGALTLTATADPGELGYITTADGLAQALGLASAAGDTVTLQGDLTLSKGLSLLLAANQTITLDLNGHTLRAGAELLHALIALSGEGTLRLTGGALRGSGEELPLVFVADGTLEVANVTIDNAGGTAARLLSGSLHAPATGEGAQAILSGKTAVLAQYDAIVTTDNTVRTQITDASGEARDYYAVFGHDLTAAAAGATRLCFRVLADDAYIVRIDAQNAASEAGSAQPWTPDVTAYSLKDGQYVTLDPDDYAFTFYKLDADGNWIVLPDAPTLGEPGSYQAKLTLTDGTLEDGSVDTVTYHIYSRGDTGVTVESVTRFVFEDDGKAYGPSVSGLLDGDSLLFSIDGDEFTAALPTFGFEDLEGQRSAVKTVHYTLQRDGLTFYGEATVKLVLLDTSVEFTTVYDHDHNKDIPYSHAIALDRPVLTYGYEVASGDVIVQGVFDEEMWRYYFQGAIYQLLVDGSTEDRKTVLGETQFFDPSSASTDAHAVTIKASIVPTEAGRELFDDYYHSWFLDVYGNLVASQRTWQVVKGDAQDWALKDEEGAHVVRDGGAVDLSGLIAFDDADARLDDYTPVYTVKDAAGNTIFTGVTQDRLILEPGAYTVEIALESDRYEVSATTQTYAMSLYVESEFFELALRDETRGARVDATYPAYAYAYDRSTGAFTVSAWYGTALGAYTFYGFELQDNTDGANLDLTGMTFSLTGEEGSFVSLEALNFRADKPGQYTLYYRMTGTADGEPVAGGGAVTLDIQPIDLASVIDARLDVEEGSYPSYNALYDGHAAQTSDILVLEDVRPIAPWGGYLLSVDDLTVTFVDEYGVSHVGVVDMELGDGADWLDIEEIFVQLDAYHTQLSFRPSRGLTYWYSAYLATDDKPRYELDHDWRPADFGEVGGITCVIGDPDDLDDVLRIVPELLDGHESHFSDRQFASAFEEVGLTRLDWELLVEFYDYDSLAAGTLNPGEERRLSGSMSVSSATTAEDLALLVEDMGRVGAYFIGIAYTGYNAEGAQLFTATDYVTIRTPTQLEMTVDSDTEIYYDGREHTVALDGLEEGDILEVRHQQVDAQGQPVGGEQAQFFYISGFDPDTLAPLGYVCDADGYYDSDTAQVSVLPAFLGEAVSDSIYQISYTVRRGDNRLVAHAMSARAVNVFEDVDLWRSWLVGMEPLYEPFHSDTQLTIKASARWEITGVSAEGYEGLADGDAHGFTIRGLNVEDGDVLDSVRITVRDAQGAPVSGLDGVLLSDLAAAVGADGAVYVPLLSAAGDYTVEYTVERGLLFFPFTETTGLRLLKGAPVVGVDKSVVYDAKPHTIELENLDGAQVLHWWTSVDGTQTAVQPTFTEAGTYTIFFEAQRELTGDQGTYFETYLGSAVLEIRPFNVTAGGWTGVYDGASHGVTLADVDWTSDKVEYAVGSGAFTAAASAAELPAFTDSGEYAITLRVTRENATLDIPVLVRIQPRQITGISAGTVRGYADGTDYAICVEGAPEGVEIYYYVNGAWTKENPAYRDVGSYDVPFELRGANYQTYSGVGHIDVLYLSGIVSEGFEGTWDGKAHAIELYGPTASDVVYYRVGENGVETTVKPQFTDVGKYAVYYRVERYLDGALSHVEYGVEMVNILPLNDPTITAHAYSGEYDGKHHAGVTLSGDLTGVTVRYFDNASGTWLADPPLFKDAGEYALTVVFENALGEVFSVQPVTVSIQPRQLSWDISGLDLDGVTKVRDGETSLEGALGTLGILGALEGDSVHLTYDGYLAYLLSNELGQGLPAAIEFYGLRLDNANYALPEDALFTFRVRHIPGLPASLGIPNETYDGGAHEPSIYWIASSKGWITAWTATSAMWTPAPPPFTSPALARWRDRAPPTRSSSIRRRCRSPRR